MRSYDLETAAIARSLCVYAAPKFAQTDGN